MKHKYKKWRYRQLLCISFCLVSVLTHLKAQQKPNVLIIYTDEHNFRTLGCYRATLTPDQALMWGEAVVETPNIDWIAQQGALCTSFYATTPVCAPSRAAFVSGRYPYNINVPTNDIPMDDNTVTFAQVLKEEGYATTFIGKWHLDGTAKPGWAPARKFGFEDNRYMFNRGHWKQLEESSAGPRVKARNKKGEPDYNIKGVDERSFTTDFLTQKTIDFINSQGEKPFCAMLSLPDPHGPNTVRAPYNTMYTHLDFKQALTHPEVVDNPSNERPPFHMQRHDMAQYYGMVKCIDDNVGKILDALKAKGQLDNTIIIFSSDHGDLSGEHGLLNKGNAYEASAKVPFLLYFPRKIKPAKIIDQAMSSVDFMPTLLSLMKIEGPSEMEGRDVSVLFRKKRAPKRWEDIAFIRSTPQREWVAAISDRYKLIYSAKEAPILYDLQKDPNEIINYFERPAYKEIRKDFSEALLDYGKKMGDPFLKNTQILKAVRQVLQ